MAIFPPDYVEGFLPDYTYVYVLFLGLTLVAFGVVISWLTLKKYRIFNNYDKFIIFCFLLSGIILIICRHDVFAIRKWLWSQVLLVVVAGFYTIQSIIIRKSE
jgi:hypothetical protein